MSKVESKVDQAILQVMGSLSKEGIGKNRKAPDAMGGYSYRSIDDVVDALPEKLVAAGLVIVPRVTQRLQETLQDAAGKTSFHVCLEVTYLMRAGGEEVPVVVWGEGTDRNDKATNKALSAAYKYMVFQTFCVPLVGIDSEAEVEQQAPAKAAPQVTKQAKPQAAETNGHHAPAQGGAPLPEAGKGRVADPVSNGGPEAAANRATAQPAGTAAGPAQAEAQQAPQDSPGSMAYEEQMNKMIDGAESMEHMGEIDAFAKKDEVRKTLSKPAKDRLLTKFKSKLAQMQGAS